MRAQCAELGGELHRAVQGYLFCLEASESARDLSATCFFAEKLATIYTAMGFPEKAQRYRALVDLAAQS